MQTMHMLMAYEDRFLQELNIRFPRLKISHRMLLIAAGAISGLSLITVATAVAMGGMPHCTDDQSLLAYPQYTARGVILGYDYRCGLVHRTCKLREDGTEIYDCSPLAMPGRLQQP